MPLSQPVAREPLHRRSIELVGYSRTDGLYDVEAHLVDTKTYAFSNKDMLIVAFEANTEFGPYTMCPQAAPNFSRLAGLRVGRGFIKAANERIGGVHGCTHLRELLAQMGTVAFQTLYAMRVKRNQAPNAETTSEASETQPAAPRKRPAMLGTCMAYAPDSPVVKRTWPEFYTGA